jgi:uncharacterized protein YukE
MSMRVLSTDEARSAITQMSNIINGGLADQISQLDAQGNILMDANTWDGMLAGQFRNEIWPQTNKALQDAKAALDELRQKISQINQNIMTAGGNG